MASVSAMSWSPYLSTRASTPCASLTFLTGSTTRKSSVSLSGGAAAARSRLLHCSFISSSSIASTSAFSGNLPSIVLLLLWIKKWMVELHESKFLAYDFPSFSNSNASSLSVAGCRYFHGLSLGLDLSSSVGVGRRRGSGLVVRAGKAALCLTKRSRSRKSLARTHGFRRRMRTTGGRAMMKRRRAKGRKVLCTKSNPSSGKRA
ncbi:hypothetical protein DVH24_011431 [Malus domestica]|uniref:Large ribosomal subunit protein bL34c n=1 Tax=Malus domestica TaxID=3750 RepID=A0A498JVK1_MALDO|nr:hypothetical protein DVH24_011431 [Malus domestica]